MGLDLMMYRRKDFDGMLDNDLPWREDMELAYGRKTWAIAHFFSARSDYYRQKDYCYLVPESAWDEFYNTCLPYVKQLDDMTKEMYFLEEKENADEAEADCARKRHAKLYDEVYNILDKCLDDTDFQLGADWEARAVVRWVDAYEKVKKVYANGEDVIMDMSY